VRDATELVGETTAFVCDACVVLRVPGRTGGAQFLKTDGLSLLFSHKRRGVGGWVIFVAWRGLGVARGQLAGGATLVALSQQKEMELNQNR
jgi:hypothetical protein